MQSACPSCGREAPPSFRFCGYCGSALEPTIPLAHTIKESPIERSARRYVSVLFADLANFTRLAERADPEIVYLTIRNILERLSKPVKNLGGRIDRYVGDGFLATFGVPEAHEDDPSRAVLASLEMQQMMEDLRAEAKDKIGWDIQLRVGINVGSVISGSLDTGSLTDWSVFGHTVNLTSRLQEAARPGTVLVSEAAYRLTRLQFQYQEPIKLQLKNIDKPVIGYELAGKRTSPYPRRGLIGRPTAHVGRQREYETMLNHLQKMSLERRGFIALIAGEAGIGKTRFVDEVVTPQADHFTIVKAQCSSYETSSYSLFTKIIENLFNIDTDDPASLREKKYLNLLPPSEELHREFKPVFDDLVVGQPIGEQGIRDPKQRQRLIFSSFRRLFNWLARRTPTILMLDDLQWADPASLDVLSHVVDLIFEIPLALIAISRSSEVDRPPGYFREQHHLHPENYREIQLQPLSPEESDRLISMLLSEVALPSKLLQVAYERTRGNPLLIEELIRVLLDERIVYETPQGWELDSQWTEAIQKVPDTITGLMLNRYDRQPLQLKKLLDITAVLGQSFHLSLLAAMTKMRDSELRDLLFDLERKDFIHRSASPGEHVYHFRHALMQETIYKTLLQEERRELHLKTAEAIQQTGGDFYFDSDAIIGHHLARGNSREAAKYLLKAAIKAANSYANEEAIIYYQRANSLLSHTGPRKTEALDVALGLGEIFIRQGKLEEAIAWLTGSLKSSETRPGFNYRIGDIYYTLGLAYAAQGSTNNAIKHLKEATTLLKTSPAECLSFTQSDIDRGLGWVLSSQGKMDEARTMADSALAIAKEHSDLAAIGSAHSLLSAIDYWEGKFAEAIKDAEHALSIREEIGDMWGAASSQTTLGHLYHRQGQWSKAESCLRQAIYVQKEIGDYHTLPGSLTNLGLLLIDMGRLEEALHYMNEAISTLPPPDLSPSSTSTLLLNHGVVLIRLEEPQQALRDFESAFENASQAQNDDLCALSKAYMAEAKLISKDDEAAQRLIKEAEAYQEKITSPDTRAEILRVKSLIQQAKKKWEAALNSNAKAQKLYQQIGNDYEVARRLIEAIEIQQAQPGFCQEKFNTIQEDIQKAINIFQRLSAHNDLSRAESLWLKIQTVMRAEDIHRVFAGPFPAIVAILNFRIPGITEGNSQVQEKIAGALNKLRGELRNLGKYRNAISTATDSGLAFVFFAPSQGTIDNLGLAAIETAISAVDACIRLNRTLQKQEGLEIGLGIGITAGHSLEWIDNPEQAGLFASISRIGRHAKAAADVAQDYQILLTDDIPNSIRSAYKLLTYERSHDDRLPEQLFVLSLARSDAKLSQELPGSSPRFIGRNKELSMLCNWIDQVRGSPNGRICYMEAEAGMGKTRLLEELIGYGEPEVLYLVGKCESFRSNISYWPIIDILEHNIVADYPAGQRLKELLGLQPQNIADNKQIHKPTNENYRRELNSSMREYLLQLSQMHRIVLVIEDIHWLDLSSIDLLDFLLPVTLEAPISLLLVARAEMPGAHRALVVKAERVCTDQYLWLKFSELDLTESWELVKALLNTNELPNGLTKLLDPFKGHPLSIEEALRYLIERGWLYKQNGSWSLEALEPSLRNIMPDNFRQLLLGRLDALDSETLHVLQAAAVLGENFDRTVLSRMIPGAAIYKRLAELMERGWLYQSEPQKPANYNFRHTLTRETIYSTIMTSKKQLLHQRGGEAIESLYGEAYDENLELMAYHFGESSLRDKSLHYLIRAAEKSADRHALGESLNYYQRAKEIWQAIKYTQPRLMPRIFIGLADVYLDSGEPAKALNEITSLTSLSQTEISTEVQIACMQRMGRAQHMIGELDTALEHYRTALKVLEKWLESTYTSSTPILGSTERTSYEIQQGIAQIYFDMRKNQLAGEQAKGIVETIDQYEYPELTAESLNLLAGIAYRESHYNQAEQWLEQCLAIYQAYGNRSKVGATYSNMGLIATTRNDLQTAHHRLMLSLSIHEALGDAVGIVTARNNLGQLEKRRNQLTEARHHLTIAVETARRSELNQLLGQALANLGQISTYLGEPQKALHYLEEAETLCKSYDFSDLLCEVYWKKAECLVEYNRLTEAQELGEAALELSIKLNSKDLECEARRILGRIFRHLGKHQEALNESYLAWENQKDSSDPITKARFAAEQALSLWWNDQRDESSELIANLVSEIELAETPSLKQALSEHFNLR
ncbi:MAG: tetratricopeptide repeat protein [Chloroflexota bacterium]